MNEPLKVVDQVTSTAIDLGMKFGPKLVVALAMAILMPASAFAENLTFKVRSFHKNQVDIAFYSQNRNHVWPSGGKVWVIKDYDTHDYKLSCVKGEKICYGAWVRNARSTYWGSGSGGKHRCDSCCFTCNGGTTPVMNLNAR